ncbi:site-specific integrase [Pokkaliibacter sp. MBI-7]|uniref:tyrosine-type recombinase/integrase n=1 Tax=Pokkaliibacter sp. MBI-7 TaxID=3040600 RepID=UPI002449A984|nr:site-specific integrase [Pokkaliibacter sp. MBI-7]MDH2430977.1 site-specific integrase [Pokkaliibacter sp. MBI-7]MDH2436772.1 site-specific integrase [Pokkaliibacter sp. MBI-7]
MEQQAQGSTKPITWEELLEEYRLQKRVKPVTLRNYGIAIRCFQKFQPDVLPEQVTHKQLLYWREAALDSEPGLKPISWNTYIDTLRHLFRFGLESALLQCDQNPFYKLKVRETDVEFIVLGTEDMDAYRQHLDRLAEKEKVAKQVSFRPVWFHRCLLETLYNTGMRLHQLLHLHQTDINLQKNTIHLRAAISKNGKSYSIPIAEPLRPYLEQLLENAKREGIRGNEQLFNLNRFRKRYQQEDTPMKKSQVHYFFGQLSRQVNCKVTSHAFRHTIATTLMRHPDRNLMIAQALLGHRSLRSTLRYVTVDMDQIREALNNR